VTEYKGFGVEIAASAAATSDADTPPPVRRSVRTKSVTRRACRRIGIFRIIKCVAVCCRVPQHVAVCCNMLQRVHKVCLKTCLQEESYA